MNITVGMVPQLLFAVLCLKSLLPAVIYQCREYFVDVLLSLCLLLFWIYQKMSLLLALFHRNTAYNLQVIYIKYIVNMHVKYCIHYE